MTTVKITITAKTGVKSSWYVRDTPENFYQLRKRLNDGFPEVRYRWQDLNGEYDDSVTAACIVDFVVSA